MTTEEAVEQVRSSFAPELAELCDEALRQKVVRAWARAMVIGGSADLIADQPMNPDLHNPGVGFEHVRAVVRLSMAIADALVSVHHMKLDRDVIAAGALLHDVGKLPEHAPAAGHPLAGPMVRHAFSGVAIAAEEGLPREVLHIIAYHSVEGQRVRRTAECEVVYRADEISADTLYRRDVGISRAERTPYVFLPRVLT